MTNNDYTPVSPSPFGTETLVDAPTEELHYGPPPPPPTAPSGDFLFPHDRPRGRRRGTAAVGAAAVVAVALGSGLAGAEFATRNVDNAKPAAVASPLLTSAVKSGAVPAQTATTQPREQLAQVAAAVQPSVVAIAVQGANGSGGEGSGVILSSDGLILTNNHVAEVGDNGGKITVKFSDGKSADATILGRDAGSDLAVLKAQNASGLTAATLGDDTQLHVGDTVLAIGSPLGLEGSVSAGIVSALHRPVALGGGSLGDAIQTDAPINPGNSGGALVDMNGHVIGINTAIASLGSGLGGQSGSIGLGFAIPITHAKTIADQLAKGQTPSQGRLGVDATDAPSGGALIRAVTTGSAAEKAGLKTGDIVIAVGDSRISDAASMTAAIRSRQPGEAVKLTYTRGGTSSTTTATLGSATP
jgi:putative serine protease PepD